MTLSARPDPRLTAAVDAYDKTRGKKRSKAAHRAGILAAIKAYASWTCATCGIAHRGPSNGCPEPTS